MTTKKREIKLNYNYLNLPTLIDFGTAGNIMYIYDATGVKLQKVVNDAGNIIKTTYASGFIYEETAGGEELKFFSHPEGYVEPVASGGFNYVYQYKDIWQNIRLTYSDTNNDGVISTSEIRREQNYYPFGLKHKGYGSPVSAHSNDVAKKFKYNGKELQDELGLQWYDYQARNYDPAIGRWFNIDPASEMSRRFSPYTFAFNSPLYFVDPDGMWPTPAWMKKYVKGAWKATGNLVVGTATSLIGTVSNGVSAVQNVSSAYNTGGVTGVAKQYAKSVYETSGAKSAVSTIQKASKGEAEAVATTVVNVAAVLIMHQVAKGGGGVSESPAKKAQVTINAEKGAAFENVVTQHLKDNGHTNIAEQVTIQPNNHVGKVRLDQVSTNNGSIALTDAKSSATAGHTTNQTTGYPALEQNGGVVKGNNGAANGYPAGTEIPPTKVNIVRPDDI